MGNSVVHFLTQAFSDGHFADDLNESLITLIPKQDLLETIAQFLPIALSNVVVKIITMVIANRLKPLMGSLVYVRQCNFIPGRQHIDNVVIV